MKKLILNILLIAIATMYSNLIMGYTFAGNLILATSIILGLNVLLSSDQK